MGLRCFKGLSSHDFLRHTAEVTVQRVSQSQQQTPNSRARRLIRNHMETPGHTLEELFVEIAREIDNAEQRGRQEGKR